MNNQAKSDEASEKSSCRPKNSDPHQTSFHQQNGGGANSSSSNRERDQIGSGELYCDEHSCLDSSHIHFKHSAVATAAAVAVCTYSGCQDGLSDEAREILGKPPSFTICIEFDLSYLVHLKKIEKTAIEFKRAMNLQKARDRIRSIAKYKNLAYLSFLAFIIILTLVLIILAAMGVFNIN
ncbi:unnamed protein product [Lepeophtheirus salmonis]|uniref:(salmon louse) hypothetical protein n=1 Tax=Lepeophtheirus salmonis TaxID=72036 RepID=A0A7R8H0U4_LEPSM|nr:unnamed protein product [Lepeophtheirus salmonis]CAF2796056.1 unnamed protein product [Lepeophtheirus salmonis]